LFDVPPPRECESEGAVAEARVEDRTGGVKEPLPDAGILFTLDLLPEDGDREAPEGVSSEADGEGEQGGEAVPLVGERVQGAPLVGRLPAQAEGELDREAAD
jgi:hypothetical protein